MELLFYLFIKPFTSLLEVIFAILGRVMDTAPALMIAYLVGGILFAPIHLSMKKQKEITACKEESGKKRLLYSALITLFAVIIRLLLIFSVHIFVGEMSVFSGKSMGFISDLTAPDGGIRFSRFQAGILPLALFLFSISNIFLFKKSKMVFAENLIEDFLLVIMLLREPSGAVLFWIVVNGLEFVFELTGRLVSELKRKGKIKAFSGKTPKDNQTGKENKTEDHLIFVAGILFIVFFVGFYIPTGIIKISPEEFVDISNVKNPLHYLIYSMALSVGFFGIWGGILYYFSDDKIKSLLQKLVWIVSCVASVNYIVAGNYMGEITPLLVFFEEREFETGRIVISVVVSIIIAALIFLLMDKKKDILKLVFLAETGVLLVSIVMNAVSVTNDYKKIYVSGTEEKQEAPIVLDKNGENVLIITVDRALGCLVPFIFEEKPELEEQFDGFTYYPNTVSFGAFTNTGIPAVYGGYEYTPEEMNKRSDEYLEDKHNESLKVLPVLFSENNYKSIVLDPAYAGYNWIPDLSVFEEYPEISTYNTTGKYNYLAPDDFVPAEELLKRNFFMYSVMKIVPLTWQSLVYDRGYYCDPNYNVNKSSSLYVSEGYYTVFLESYLVLDNLPDITKITDENTNYFVSFYNATPHMQCKLQEPDYIPKMHVDNREFHENDGEVRESDGRKLYLTNDAQIEFYHVNVATYLELGKWFDFLKENDCYDNTRIIIVSDHGADAGHFDSVLENGMDIENFLPVLMVKDFNAHGMSVDQTLMTNADVARLAVKDLISNPLNPFTGNSLDKDYKEDMYEIRIFYSEEKDLRDNSGKTYKPGHWFSVHDNPYNHENWTYLGPDK